MCIIGVLFKIIHIQYSCYGNAHGDRSVDHTGIPGSPITGSAHGAGAALSPAANAVPAVEFSPLSLAVQVEKIVPRRLSLGDDGATDNP